MKKLASKQTRAKSVSETGELTPQMEEFCRQYIIHLNATKAALSAGYAEASATQQASRHLTNPLIQDFIQKLMDERSKRTEITADYVLSTIKTTIERCLQAEQVMEFNHDTKSMEPTGEWKFEPMAVLKGSELLGRHLKMFTDKIEHSGTADLAARLAAARKRREKK